MTEEDLTRDHTQNFWHENEMPDRQNLLVVVYGLSPGGEVPFIGKVVLCGAAFRPENERSASRALGS
jgi:hypothetical protein